LTAYPVWDKYISYGKNQAAPVGAVNAGEGLTTATCREVAMATTFYTVECVVLALILATLTALIALAIFGV
jgi:hypothetical protein